MRVIRAERNLFVPQNPEKPDKNSMRLVPTGLVALVPDEYKMPEGSFKEIGKVKFSKSKKDEE